MNKYFDVLLIRFSQLAHQKVLAAVLAGALPLSIGIAAACLKGPLLPLIYDEYSNWLAADTFAHLRLTNPPHQLQRHFENFDILNFPTRMSRRPPAPGLFLAGGWMLTGQPIAGSIIGAALACSAIYWALLAWIPPPWALLGAWLAGIHPLVFTWSITYWGGTVGLLGGALVLGAWRRAVALPTPKTGALFGLGLALLANSRPFEGMLLSIPLSLSLAWRLLAKNKNSRERPLGAALALAAVLMISAAAMGYYNFRITGSALRFPYMVYEETYASIPFFIWQDLKPPKSLPIKELDDFFNRWHPNFIAGQNTWPGYFSMVKSKLSSLVDSWLQPWPLKFIFAAGLLGLSGPLPPLLLAGFIISIVFLTRVTMFAHYCAPAGVLFFLITLCALRRLSGWHWRGWRAGRWVAAAILTLCLAELWTTFRNYPPGTDNPCAKIKQDFASRYAGGKHLVFARYEVGQHLHHGWVYNDADMDASQVIWARELSREENCRLAEHYKDRAIWLLEISPPKANFKLLRSALTQPNSSQGPQKWRECDDERTVL